MKVRALILVGLLAWGGRARAADPTFQYGKAEEVEKVKDVEWKAQAQVGLVMTTGNSRTTTFSGGGTASRKAGGNKLALEAGGAYTSSDLRIATDANGDGMIQAAEIARASVVSSESWFAKIRYDRFFTARNSAFVSGTIGADKPAGKELLGGGQVGYARLLTKDDVNELVAEVGYDLTYEDYVAAADAVVIHSARLFVGWTGTLSETVGLEASIATLVNLNEEDSPTGTIAAGDDVRALGRLGLTATLWKDL